MSFWNSALKVIDPELAAVETAKKSREVKIGERCKMLQEREQELLKEVKKLNEEVTRARKELWKSQDQVGESDDKIRELTNHVSELLQQRVEDDHTIQHLKQENMKLVEGEMKVRESLDLMKTVFTRAQLKTREDQETISDLRSERDMLHAQLRKVMRGNDKSALHALSSAEIKKMTQGKLDKEKGLKKLLNNTDQQLHSLKREHDMATETIHRLRNQMNRMQEPTEVARQMDKQRRVIGKLERQIGAMEQQQRELRDDVNEDDDDGMTHRYEEVLNRAFCDEDLDGSLTKQFMSKLDFSSSYGR